MSGRLAPLIRSPGSSDGKLPDHPRQPGRFVRERLACRRRFLDHRGVLLGGLVHLVDGDVDLLQAMCLLLRRGGDGFDARADLLQGVDLLTFTSGSTAQNFFAALEIRNSTTATAKLAALGNPAIACIGPVTAETVRAFDLPVDIMATDHTIPGLLDALVAYYRAHN